MLERRTVLTDQPNTALRIHNDIATTAGAL